MKRLYIAAVAGLCAVAPVRAQEGGLAPTVPVVPPPMLQNGSVVPPDGSGPWGTSGTRLFSRSTWSPVRSPVVAGGAGYTGYATPPLPPGVGGGPGCGPAGCGPAGCGPAHDGFCWSRFKAWVCYHPTNTELPRFRPTPYVTPIQGLFSCGLGAGCATGCGAGPGGNPGGNYPLTPPIAQPQPVQMPAPVRPPNSAGAVMMPARAPAPTTWRTQLAAGPTEFGVAPGNKSAQKPAQGPVVNTGYLAPR